MSEFPQRKPNKICYVVTISLTVRAFLIPQLRYLAEQGYDVTVICSGDDALPRDLGSGVRFVPISIPRGPSPFETIRAAWSLFRFFRQERFDLVQYSTPNASLCASAAAWAAGCKRRNYHLMGLRYLGAKGVGRQLLKSLERLACRLSTSIECVSSSNLELGVREKLFPRKKAAVVWNGSSGGVDLKRFDISKRPDWRCQVRRELGYSEDDFIFGYVGRITRDKGINEILAAFRGLDGSAKLLLVGNLERADALDPSLLSWARNEDSVLFHKSVADVQRYYAALDVLLLPSYREGFGNVVIEAAAVGTPAIVSCIPGPVDAVLDGKTALMVPPGDANALTARMEQIMRMDHAAMGAAAAAHAANHFDSDILNTHILQRKRQLLQG